MTQIVYSLPSETACAVSFSSARSTVRVPVHEGMPFARARAIVRKLNRAAVQTVTLERGKQQTQVATADLVRMLAEDWQAKPDHDRLAILNAWNG